MRFIHRVAVRRAAMLALAWAAAMACGEGAAAQGLAAPPAIVLHVHAGIADTSFLAPLERMLAARLAPPLRVAPSTLDLSPHRAWTGPMPAEAALRSFILAVHDPAAPDTLHVLLTAEDMRLAPARFNFAVSGGGPGQGFRAIVVSLARLQQRAMANGADRDPLRTAMRVARMVVKNTARTAGLVDSDRCVMGFPTGLADLDAMPEGFCEPDLARLVSAGVALP